MIEIISDQGHLQCKIDGNLLELLADTRYISTGIAQALLQCTDKETEMIVLCCMQSIFSDTVSYALREVLARNSKDADKASTTDSNTSANISSVRVDMQALREFLNNQSNYPNDEDESEDNENENN